MSLVVDSLLNKPDMNCVLRVVHTRMLMLDVDVVALLDLNGGPKVN